MNGNAGVRVARRTASVLFAAALLLASAPASLVAQEQTIKIGVLLPLSGPAGSIGNEVLRGYQYVLDGVNSTVAGKRIQSVVVDDQNSPTVALNEARRLVETEKVAMLVGTLNGSIALALAAYAERMKVPYVTGTTAGQVTGAKKNAFTFRAGAEAVQFQAPLAGFLQKHGFRRGILMGSDYVTGRDTIEGVAKSLTAAGGTVVKQVFPRLGETDYAPYFSDLADQRADFVYGFFFGGDSLRFARAYRASGLKFPLVLIGSSISVGDVAQQLGADVEGIYTNEIWIWTLTDTQSKALIDGYAAKYRERPGTLSPSGYCMGKIVVEGVQAVGGNVADGTALARGIERVRFVQPGGQVFRFDENHDTFVMEAFVQWHWRNGAAVPQVLDIARDLKRPSVAAQ
jgi:branched-chain amino acid transport system substrate-binding protein